MTIRTPIDATAGSQELDETPLVVGVTRPHRAEIQHLVFALEHSGCEVVRIDDATLRNAEMLAHLLGDIDVVVHDAAAEHVSNRIRVQQTLADAWSIVWASEARRVAPDCIVLSTTCDRGDAAVDACQAEAGEILMDWARRAECTASTLVLPELFGPELAANGHRASTVAAICERLLDGSAGDVADRNPNDCELMWVGDFADEVADYVINPSDETGRVRIHGELVATQVELFEELSQLYTTHVERGDVPDLSIESRSQLYATLVAMLPPELRRAAITRATPQDPKCSRLLTTAAGGMTTLLELPPGGPSGKSIAPRDVVKLSAVAGDVEVEVKRAGKREFEQVRLDAAQACVFTIPPMTEFRVTALGTTPATVLQWVSSCEPASVRPIAEPGNDAQAKLSEAA